MIPPILLFQLIHRNNQIACENREKRIKQQKENEEKERNKKNENN